MSFAYTTTLGVFVVAAMMQLSVLQEPPLPLDQVNGAVSQWHTRLAGEDDLISEDEIRSDAAMEKRKKFVERQDGAGSNSYVHYFWVCWFDRSDTDRNGTWDEEERMKVFDDYAGEDRQMSLEEAYRYAKKHYDNILNWYHSGSKLIAQAYQDK